MEYQVSEKRKKVVEDLLALPQVQQALKDIKEDHEHSLEEQKMLALIASPTFHEQEKAKKMVSLFEELGLDAKVEQSGNAVGIRKGNSKGKIAIDGHMDTVYPLDTELVIKEDEKTIWCPGICDDTRALAVMLSVIRALNKNGIETEKDLVFVGTVQEEGKGGFGGMKMFCKDHTDIDAYVNIDGAGAQGMIYQSTGFKTIEVTFHGVGAHAFMGYGQVANALSAAARACSKIAEIRTPDEPKTTVAVTNFHAGNDAGIHAIVNEATIKVNYRSNGKAELEELDRQIMQAFEEACKEESERWGKNEITYTIKTWCDVPVGSLDEHAPIVETVWTTIEQTFRLEPYLCHGGCTNASVPIGLGIPAVCLGAGEEECYVHNAKLECFPKENTWRLPQLALVTILALAGIKGVSESTL